MKTTTLLLFLFFSGILIAQPDINQPNDLVVCDTDYDGFSLFDLTVNENQTLNGLSTAQYNVSYYETLADAENDSSPVVNTSAYTNTINPQLIYVRVTENADPNNFATTSFNIMVNIPPAINQPPDIRIYDDNNDGFGTFDLTSIHDIVLNGIDPSLVTLNHYETLNEAQNDSNAITNPSNYNNILQGSQLMYIVATDVNTDCRIMYSYGIYVDPDTIVSIPDANFKNALLNHNPVIDTNSDNEIQISEAVNFTGNLTLHNQGISNLTGIEAFVNILELGVQNNLFTTVDISNNTALTRFDCFNCPLESLDVTNNPDLEFLRFTNGTVSNIDVTNNTLLTVLSCDNNQLISIDVSNNTILNFLGVSGNELTALDVSANLNLGTLQCAGNQLPLLDVSNNLLLNFLIFSNNPISTIDLSNNDSIQEVFCNNTLITELDLSNMQNLQWAVLQDNPNLTYVNIKNGNNDNYFTGEGPFINVPNLVAVCVDDGASDFSVVIATQINHAAVITDYCTFVPGGNYNTITGVNDFDSDNNGCDINDASFPYMKINIDDGTETGATFTTNNGEYNFYTQQGNFTITPDLENPSFFNVTPIETTINFPDNNNNIATQNFCIAPSGIHPDVEVAMASTIPARPGFDAEYIITYRNKGNQTLSGGITLSYNAEVLDYVSSSQVPISENGALINWSYLDLLPFESRTIEVVLNVNSPMESPAVNIDDILDFIVEAEPIIGDEFPGDNTFNYNETVVGSFDPNDIACIEGNMVAPSEIGNYLHYLIRFENTGNAAAENVVLKTEVDLTQFDINSLRLLSSSHDPYVRVEGNTVEFVFENINLEASGGHGNVLMRMRTKASLEANDTVTKNAEIFFDYNFPIETNDANTTFATLSTSEFGIDKSISIYPNPVKDIIRISAKENISSITLYDLQGRLLQTKITNSKEVMLDVSNRANGVYLIEVRSNNGIKFEKIIKK